MIEPEFLASLRQRHRAESVLVLVQLEQLAPGWWLTLQELAEQISTDRATLNRSICKLEKLNLLRRSTISNRGGTWIWWVKKFKDDKPDLNQEPSWLVKDVKTGTYHRISIDKRWEWGSQRSIPRQTMRSFLAGNQGLMRDRWRLVSTPIDQNTLKIELPKDSAMLDSNR